MRAALAAGRVKDVPRDDEMKDGGQPATRKDQQQTSFHDFIDELKLNTAHKTWIK